MEKKDPTHHSELDPKNMKVSMYYVNENIYIYTCSSIGWCPVEIVIIQDESKQGKPMDFVLCGQLEWTTLQLGVIFVVDRLQTPWQHLYVLD